MDMIYLEKPVLLILPAVLLLWQILSHFLAGKLSENRFAEPVCTGIGVLAHAAGLLEAPIDISARELAVHFSFEKIHGDAIYLDAKNLVL